MINAQALQQLICSRIESDAEATQVLVEGDGRHFQVIVIDDSFENLSAVQRQQKVYAVLMDEITSGELHAVNIKVHTKDEWARLNASGSNF